MDKSDENFLQKLLATFKIEAEEHLSNITSGLVDLGKETSDETQIKLIETLFREVHSFKGAANAVNKKEIVMVCQTLEDVFAKLKRKEILADSEFFNVLHGTTSLLSKLNSLMDSEISNADNINIGKIVESLKELISGSKEISEQEELKAENSKNIMIPKSEINQSTAIEKHMFSDTIRISTSDLDILLLQIEEMLFAKLSAYQRLEEIKGINLMHDQWEKKWLQIFPEIRKIQLINEEKNKQTYTETEIKFSKFIDQLDWSHNQIELIDKKLKTLEKTVKNDGYVLSGMVDDLLKDMKKILLQPFSLFLEVIRKLIRDVQYDEGRDIDLIIHGDDVQIDKRILEEMKDPLVHLIRNCIDHGIEKPAERLKKGKPPKGKISIDVSQKSTNEVEILISDDGAGFNLEKIKSSAVKLGVLSQTDSENMSDTEIISLTFLSGISSSPIITHTSGRGLGLAIVLEKVEKLTGNISVESLPDVGTTFKIRLPLTLAAFRGIIVRLNEQHFVIPTINIERVLRTNIEQIKTVKNKETIEFEERAVSLVRLKDVLELPQTLTDYSIRKVPIVVLSLAQKRIAFQVDEILNEQEVLIKNYGGQLSRVRNFLGATILGSGKVVPIINVSDLFKSAVRFGRTEPITIMKTINDDVKLKKVLVVEDSITSRTLLKNILISAGYNVETAVDGIDGFTKLCMDEFDIVVSDVDMPKMNGFDLTAKIRNDKKYSNIPVVLVTSLESNEHKEHGIDVGANAYIVKSSFDQGNLLEIIRRLV